MKRLLLVACIGLMGILNGQVAYSQCGTTPITGDLIITSNTSLSGTYNITGLFRVNPGVVCSVTPYTSGGCGELIINAADIEVMGDIIGDGSGYPGGSGGAGASTGNNAAALNGCVNKDNCLVITVNSGTGGAPGSGPGAGQSGTAGTNGVGPKQECQFFGDDYGFVGGAGGAGGSGGGSYGGVGQGGGAGGAGGPYNSGLFSGANIAGCAAPAAGNAGPGGVVNPVYGTLSGTDIDLGSGGAGGGGGGKSAGNGTAGQAGGSGGALVALYSAGTLTVAGNISVNGANSGSGGAGGNGGKTSGCCEDLACPGCDERTYASGAGGGGGAGGGSGGGILLQGYGVMNVTGTLRSLGGRGGDGGPGGLPTSTCSHSNLVCSGTSGGVNGGSGGNLGGGGSGGRIKIFQNPCQNNVVTPTTLLTGGTGFGGTAGIGTYHLGDIGTIVGPTATTSADSVSCFGLSDGSATVTISGGTAPFTYSWDDPAMQNTATATGLLAGTYNVTVIDSFGCEVTETVNVLQPDILSIQMLAPVDADCYGASTGEAEAVVLGGTEPYTYSWNDPQGQNTPVAVDLPAGTWVLDVVDANGCTAVDSAVVGEVAPFAASYTADSVSCNGLSDGQATVTATGTNLTYSWDTNPVQTTATATGLAAGTYNVTIASSQTCDTTIVVTILEPDVLTVSTTFQMVSCNGGNNGQATATVQGGTPAYTYVWDDPLGQQTAVATGLTAGTYNVVVTDANQCVANASVNVTEATPINIGLQVDSTSCNGASDGQILAVVTGGTPGTGYQYTWTPGPVQGNPLTGVPAGVYSLQVTDANNCLAEFQNINVPEPAALIVTLVQSENVSCNGANDGMAEVAVVGGTPAYTYVWDDPNAQNTAAATGLATGTYGVSVTDANGCTGQVAGVVITQPDELVASIVSTTPITCDYSEDGIAEATVVGGTTPYAYLWNDADAQTSSTAIGLGAGDYTLSVTDANGCTTQVTATIDPPVFFLNADFTVDPMTGQQPMEVTVTNLSEGGTAYEWIFGDGNTITTYDTASFQFLYVDSGSFTLTLVAYNDITGCTDTLSLQDGIYIEPTSELVVPNVITPNGDGINDMFPIDPVENNFYPFLIRNIYDFKGEIYNRWGEKVYEWNLPLAGWDGRSTSGKELNNGTYYFVITAKGVDGDKVTDYQFKGDVTLIK